MPLVREWQERPLEKVYAAVYMDAIHYHVQSRGQDRNELSVSQFYSFSSTDYIAVAYEKDGYFLHCAS